MSCFCLFRCTLRIAPSWLLDQLAVVLSLVRPLLPATSQIGRHGFWRCRSNWGCKATECCHEGPEEEVKSGGIPSRRRAVEIRGQWGMEVESRMTHAARSDCTPLIRRVELFLAYTTSTNRMVFENCMPHTSLPPTTLRPTHRQRSTLVEAGSHYCNAAAGGWLHGGAHIQAVNVCIRIRRWTVLETRQYARARATSHFSRRSSQSPDGKQRSVPGCLDANRRLRWTRFNLPAHELKLTTSVTVSHVHRSASFNHLKDS
ncbi:hypothetical protein CC86DRAFT_374647 [Ophiobolus disseminans]|uniref:Secreted protein n=1 Tax=Ophiobolus disseminans TaxID=1469910 RepID=A0A6A6ZI55_9PLEO|nr:hypothetical protein CC86DRAFT_374647 [Ophiobolus disseminans]